MIKPGFKAPWNKGGGYPVGGQRKVVKGMPEWWQDLPPGVPNYDKMAQTAANLIQNQFTLIRRKQLDCKARLPNAVPPSKDDTDFLLRAQKEIMLCRALVLREKVELSRQVKSAKPVGNAFSDPRAADVIPGDGDGEFAADGRAAS